MSTYRLRVIVLAILIIFLPSVVFAQSDNQKSESENGVWMGFIMGMPETIAMTVEGSSFNGIFNLRVDGTAFPGIIGYGLSVQLAHPTSRPLRSYSFLKLSRRSYSGWERNPGGNDWKYDHTTSTGAGLRIFKHGFIEMGYGISDRQNWSSPQYQARGFTVSGGLRGKIFP